MKQSRYRKVHSTMSQEPQSERGDRHIFEAKVRSNPSIIVVTAPHAESLGIEVSGRGYPVMITREGAFEVIPDEDEE